jgi:hypothetical protein
LLLDARHAADDHQTMDVLPASLIALLAAVAGPVGVSLGWWLGRRGERERQGREERKSAYLAFVRASIRYRNADGVDERRTLRDERWAALAEVVLVAPPSVVQAAAYMVSTGDRLLDPALSGEERLTILREMWDNNVEFTRLARTDLAVGAANPFEGIDASVADSPVMFGRPRS